jgi:hypothetical protein
MYTAGITQYIVVELIGGKIEQIFIFSFSENLKNNHFWTSQNQTCFAWHIVP